MSSASALYLKIGRIRRGRRPIEPQTLSDFNVFPKFRITINKQPFLLIDINLVDEKKIMVFSTVNNIRCLADAEFWIMDGMFKTVPTLFYQLYSIHKGRIFQQQSTTYCICTVLMTSKSQAAYKRLFMELKAFATQIGVTLAPRIILGDLEKPAINASRNVSGNRK